MDKARFPWLWVWLPLLTVLAFALNWLHGAGGVALSALWSEEGTGAIILWDIRLPRSLLAVLIGAAMAMSGAAMQGLLRNPLADPGLLGVSGGSALSAVIVLYFGMASLHWLVLPAAAIAGSALALLVMMLLAGWHSSVYTLILAGVAVNAITSALITVALNFAPNLFAVQEIVFWLLGSLANRSFDHVWLALPFIVVGMCLLLLGSRFLDALTLGEDVAASLGFSLTQQKLLILFGVSACVGASVAVSGTVGFVGLVVPHLLRPLVGYSPARLLPSSALGGALLVLLADWLARQVGGAGEIKLGVVTALLGAPFFLFLVVHSRNRWL